MILDAIYGIYILIAIVYVGLKAEVQNEINVTRINNETIPLFFIIVVKAIPAFLLVVIASFDYMAEPNFSSNLLVALAFIWCMIGDITITQKIEFGVFFFSLAHLTFISILLIHALPLYTSLDSFSILWRVIILLVIVGMILVYIIKFVAYLESGEGGLGELKLPIIFYSALLAGTFLTAVLYFLVDTEVVILLLPLGSLLFLISDSYIAVREFHHHISYATIKVMTTYYLALLFLSYGLNMI